MSISLLHDRSMRLFIGLAAFFCVNAVLAEFIGLRTAANAAAVALIPLLYRARTASKRIWSRASARQREHAAAM
ncbi:MAG: hypothetical protein JWL98_1167 [Xanthomonadaceae bacterium]|nr:hypothetical protein [Xanthomonadaceae bacterium]